MCRVIAVSNQKGGVGKTTSTVNLGVAFVRKGHKVLVIDADAQASLTESLGFHQTDEIEVTLSSIMEIRLQSAPASSSLGFTVSARPSSAV